jgi:hypothetical protein
MKKLLSQLPSERSAFESIFLAHRCRSLAVAYFRWLLADNQLLIFTLLRIDSWSTSDTNKPGLLVQNCRIAKLAQYFKSSVIIDLLVPRLNLRRRHGSHQGCRRYSNDAATNSLHIVVLSFEGAVFPVEIR